MSDIVISCDTIARLGPVALSCVSDDPKVKTIRLDNGLVIVTNRKLMIFENVGGFDGVYYLNVDAAMIEACKREANFHSTLTISYNPLIGWASASTTFGYIHIGNALDIAPGETFFDQWRDIIARCAAPLAQDGAFGMYWQTEELELIAKASPSGRIVFETHIDPMIKPVMVCDDQDANWFAVSRPYDTGVGRKSAKLPDWLTV